MRPLARRASALATAGLLTVLAAAALPPSPASAASVVGTPCPKVGQTMGDGPGRTVVCAQRGGKRVWVLMAQGGGSDASSTRCRKPPVFTRDFIDPASVEVVVPIGGQTGSGGVLAVRSYVHPRPELAGQRLPLYAPTDMTLDGASYYRLPEAPPGYQPEYGLYFVAACGIKVQFFHVKGVVGRVAAAVPTTPSTSSASVQVRPVKIKAGEQFGWYTPGPDSRAFDFWVDDPRHTNTFIVPSHFAQSNALHAVCPYDFYTPALRAAWLSRLGSPGGTVVPGTPCGTVNQGVAGTADGMWFFSPTTVTDAVTYDGPYQSQIMLSTDAQGQIRIGGLNADQKPRQMFVSTGVPGVTRPADVRAGQDQCWSDDTQSVRVLLTSATTMQVVVGAGSCAALPPLASGRTYYR